MMTVMPKTRAEIAETADRIRQMGVPDSLNRWINLTPEDLVQIEERVEAQRRQRFQEEPMKIPGPKEQSVADARKGTVGRVDAVSGTVTDHKTSPALGGHTVPIGRAKKPHAADADLALVGEATGFIADVFHAKQHVKREAPTLAAARIAGEALRAELNSNRDYIVYAVLKDGRTFPVPRDYVPTATQESDMAKNATAAKKTTTGKAGAGKKSTPKNDARKAVTGATTAGKKESKSDIVDRMLKTAAGATREAMLKATNWPHVNLKVAAERAGMKLVENAEAKTFRLVPKADKVEAPWKAA